MGNSDWLRGFCAEHSASTVLMLDSQSLGSQSLGNRTPVGQAASQEDCRMACRRRPGCAAAVYKDGTGSARANLTDREQLAASLPIGSCMLYRVCDAVPRPASALPTPPPLNRRRVERRLVGEGIGWGAARRATPLAFAQPGRSRPRSLGGAAGSARWTGGGAWRAARETCTWPATARGLRRPSVGAWQQA